MTHSDIPQTVVSALPTLHNVASRRSTLYKAVGCQFGKRLHPVLEGARDVPSLDWSHCPFDLLELPPFQRLQRLNALAKVAPLADWPDRYAPWVVEGIITMRELSK